MVNKYHIGQFLTCNTNNFKANELIIKITGYDARHKNYYCEVIKTSNRFYEVGFVILYSEIALDRNYKEIINYNDYWAKLNEL